MKILNTPEHVRAVAQALKPLHVSLFEQKSCNPKHNAQRNLSGRTHYVDDDTLRWHHSRVLSSGQIGDSWGLLFRITTSDALDMHNRTRGFRCVVFDVFGTVVYRPDLEEAFPTSKAAQKACNAQEFDLVTHYREAIKSKLHYIAQECNALRGIAEILEAMEAQPITA